MASDPPLYSIPIAQRPSGSWGRFVKAILFCFLFNFGCLLINGCQFAFLVFRVLPFRRSRRLYYASIRYTKGAFGALQSQFRSSAPGNVLLMCTTTNTVV